MLPSSTAEVISVLPLRLPSPENSRISSSAPTTTWALAISLARKRCLTADSLGSTAPSRRAPQIPPAILLPLANTSSCGSEVSIAGAPVFSTASAKKRLGVCCAISTAMS